ncbi:GNAT family N-acetyltransferase [Elizabethkingia meningoseptica]|nr:GNAT family N-acetyltransferase [Elizabethkingia meningoseptica]MDE5509232.1 GNAT family N-acetyltransferase [Elizabethkingia meningoseptica]MDE5516663.1 GNAT family N-acetyltransferase [Elizabethkingia meningoseptica]MDE5527550.1 GNAT family N-acetyltransferase [Elizabethkingia meningoseptica]MDE5530902.1 GNAT family N-acetyltransferase [Elizabethkingia meningoseptica]
MKPVPSMQIELIEKKDYDYTHIQQLYNTVRVNMPFLALISDFRKELKNEIVYEAFVNDKLIAFMSLWEPDNFIHHLYILPEYQGRQIGQQMINFLAGRYGEPLGLKCLTQNIQAVNFYKKNNFYEKYRGTSENGEYIYFEQLAKKS